MSLYFLIHAVVGGLMLIISIILLTGRGSFLISGYNIMPKSKKEKYDSKALSKFMGKMLLLIAVLVVLAGVERFHRVLWFWVVWGITFVVLLVFALVGLYGNRFKK